MPTVNETTLKYREQFLKNQATFEGQFRGVFNKVAQDISRLAADPNARFTKAFNFNKPIKVKIDGIIQNFQNQTLGLTEKMISDSWDISNNKNDEIVNNYLKTVTGLKTAETASYFLPNTPALEAFISRANNATTLADTVWNISKQARAEMETHLGIGIVNGDSAQVISQRIRQYLQNPQALFRRVRDKNGKLIASQAMRENAPGQGVYNSAFKNSMRVARSETNMAYLLSDNLRWQQNDMVLGVRISLSDAHKIVDICDDLIGDYPKYFVWVGWHPQDLCNATPILMPKADFEKYLESGGKLPKGKQITEMPENFKDYMKANIDRFEGYKSQPYFITDNKAIIDGIVKGGVKNVVSPIAGIVEQAVKTEFVTAKSIQEAEQWVAGKNISIKFAENITEAERLSTINSIKNSSYQFESKFGKSFGESINMGRNRDLSFVKEFEVINDKSLNTPIGEYLRSASDYGKADSLFLNLGKLDKTGVDFAENVKDIIAGRVPSYNITSLNDIITHEASHNYYFGHNIDTIKEFKVMFEKTNIWEKSVSIYGQENASEFFAEAMVSFLRGEKNEAVNIITKHFKL